MTTSTRRRLSLPTLRVWPFTPDPAALGLYTFGAPMATTPLLLTGNSRHSLARLRRWLSPLGARALALDTGGMDLASALAGGRLTSAAVEAALRDFAATQAARASAAPAPPEQIAEAQPHTALLPYPASLALGGEKLAAPPGWRIVPGPADARDLPPFLARGLVLDPAWHACRSTLADRLELSLAHAVLFALVAALPLVLFGWQVLAAGVGLALVGALLAAVLPLNRLWQLQRRVKLLVAGVTASAGLALFAWHALSGVGLWPTSGLAVALLAAWFAVLSAIRPAPLRPRSDVEAAS